MATAGGTGSSSSMVIERLAPFKLERFFAKWEFTAPHLACCSDCQPMLQSTLLQLADPDARERWENLSLGYTETQGLPALREAVAAAYFTKVVADELVVLAPEEGIYLTMQALIQQGHEVIVTFPGYQSLFEIARSIGAVVIPWEPVLGPQGDITFNVSDLKALMTTRTRMVVVNFPHNPTGALLKQQDWLEVVASCKESGCWLFSDEMYRMLEHDPADTLPCAADVYDRGISLGGCSKVLALPGLRLGWVGVRDTALRARLMELKDYTTICPPAPSEILALVAVRASNALVARNLGIVATNVTAFQQLVDEWPTVFAWTPPNASSCAFPRLLTGEDIEVWCEALVQEAGVLLLPATVYDHAPSAAAGHFRLGLGRKNLPQCLSHLRAWLVKKYPLVKPL